MNRIRNARLRLRRFHSDDSGVSLIEVIVAVIVFSIMAFGIAQGTVLAVRQSQDSQRRTVALNLTSARLDYLRTQNAYNISSIARADAATYGLVTTIDNITYTTYQTARWVNSTGADQSCGALSDNFQLLRVRVTTVWTGMLAGAPTANSYGLIAPDATIKDPGNGTIFISVNRSDGSPYAGLPVTVLDSDGDPVSNVPNTNSDGCTYVSGLTPDTYTVKVNKAGAIDSAQQNPSVSSAISVTPGSAVPVSFSYDDATNVQLTYGPGGSTYLPMDLDTSYFVPGAQPPYYTVTGTPLAVPLFPSSNGYNVIAGDPIPANGTNPTCLSPDPDNWNGGLVGALLLKDGVPDPSIVAVPGGAPSKQVSMGAARVSLPGTGTYYIRATTSATAGPGDPGCNVAQTYNFTVRGTNAPVLALPYGSWTFGYKTNASSTTYTTTNGTATSNAFPGMPGSVVTLDPRKP